MNDPYTAAEEATDNVAYIAEKEAAKHKLEGARKHVSHIADEAKEAARDLGSAAKIGASALRDASRAKAYSARDLATDRALTARDDLESRVRREPVKYLGIALGTGFVLGWLTRG